MEKYRKFADAKYGINPFVPVKPKNPPSKFVKYTFGLVLLFVRLPLALLLLANLYIYHAIARKFIIVASIRELIETLLFRTLAMVFGIFEYRTLPKFNPRDPNRPKFSPGYIVLSNHTHPIDFIYYSQICSPTFVKVVTSSTAGPSGEKEVTLSPLDFGSTLKYFFTPGFCKAPSTGKTFKIGDLAIANHKNKEGPIVVFFEGAITNGKGVLEMPESLAYDIYEYQKQENRETVVVSITYGENTNASVAHPIVSTLSLLMNFSNNVTVRICPLSKMPIQRKDMPKTIYDIYENILELPKLALRSEDYQAFLEYWKATQGKTYSKSEKSQ